MKTIAERAREYAENEDLVQGTDGYEYCLRDYIKGATEQKVIDIDKACEWFSDYLIMEICDANDWLRGSPETGEDRFRKAMEE